MSHHELTQMAEWSCRVTTRSTEIGTHSVGLLCISASARWTLDNGSGSWTPQFNERDEEGTATVRRQCTALDWSKVVVRLDCLTGTTGTIQAKHPTQLPSWTTAKKRRSDRPSNSMRSSHAGVLRRASRSLQFLQFPARPRSTHFKGSAIPRLGHLPGSHSFNLHRRTTPGSPIHGALAPCNFPLFLPLEEGKLRSIDAGPRTRGTMRSGLGY